MRKLFTDKHGCGKKFPSFLFLASRFLQNHCTTVWFFFLTAIPWTSQMSSLSAGFWMGLPLLFHCGATWTYCTNKFSVFWTNDNHLNSVGRAGITILLSDYSFCSFESSCKRITFSAQTQKTYSEISYWEEPDNLASLIAMPVTLETSGPLLSSLSRQPCLHTHFSWIK